MTDRELLESMSRQMGELVHHVAEVRKSNKKLEAGLGEVNRRVDETNKRLDDTNKRLDETNKRLDETNRRLEETNRRMEEGFNVLCSKVDHFVEFIGSEQMRTRTAIEEERFIRNGHYEKLERRLTAIEKRVSRLESAPNR